MFWFTLFLVFLGLLSYIINWYIYANDDFWPKQGVPWVEGKILGTFWERIKLKLSIHEMDNKMYQKMKIFGKVKFAGIMEFRRPVAYLLDLDLIKNVMVKDFDYFTSRRTIGGKNDPSLLHKMLVSMDNPEWKDLRATLSPTFSTGKIRRMYGVFTESSKKMGEFLKAETKISPDIDLRDVFGRYTMDVIASAAFGVDSHNFKDRNSIFATMGYRFQNQFSGWFGAIKFFMAIIAPSLFDKLKLPVLDMEAFNFFRDVVHKTIKHRDSTGEKRNDFLQLLMESRSVGVSGDDKDEDGSDKNGLQKAVKIPLTDDLLVAQCVLFFLAGFDTTESLLMFAAYELALNPDIQSKLAQELKEASEKHGDLNYEVVNQLEYLDMVVSETLRKYPPAPRTERKCTRNYKIPGTELEFKKGQVVSIQIWSIHNDPEFYPEPEKFIPERFNKENKERRNPYSYMPFGAGPRNCIANRFAITEGKAAIAHLVHDFILKPTGRTTIPMKYSTSGQMKPVDGMWLNVTSRK